jgi:mannose-6-phosphate isomerase-like protein (cupin superfamily)
MTYPEPRYLGDTGELSATYRPYGHEPELTYKNGNNVHYLATGATTNGQFGLYRWVMGPEPSGPSPHFHKAISESFYILEGSVRIYDGARWIDTQPGDWVHVPEGGVHAFRNESGEPATMLILFTPGAPREDYFETLADPERRAALEDEDAAREFYLRHDTYWT